MKSESGYDIYWRMKARKAKKPLISAVRESHVRAFMAERFVRCSTVSCVTLKIAFSMFKKSLEDWYVFDEKKMRRIDFVAILKEIDIQITQRENVYVLPGVRAAWPEEREAMATGALPRAFPIPSGLPGMYDPAADMKCRCAPLPLDDPDERP